MRPDPSLPRREYLKAAVALGGAAGLAACLDRTGDDPVPEGVDDPATLPRRQFAWTDRVRHDDAGNTLLPRHQALWYLTLPGDGPPDDAARERAERSLAALDRAYERSHEGLLYSVAYSPAYFDRYDGSLPDGVGLREPRRLSDFETPTLDRQDVLLHLAADRADVVLEAEAALRGESDANGVDVPALTDVLTLDDRRTGFVGAGLPAANQDVTGVPDDRPVPEASPLFMGFTAGFAGNQATEDHVAVDEGPFAGGTTKVVSTLRQRLDDWYGEQEYDDRVAELFSPTHAERGWVEGVGESLGADSRVDDVVDDLFADAREHGRAGHAQKAARANRDDEGRVRLLRRHFESTDDDVASLHFPSLQRDVRAFEAVRRAMNGADVARETPAVRQRVNNGILEYVFVQHRGAFLVPPREHRALPRPRPGP
jgi:hypothetical protein